MDAKNDEIDALKTLIWRDYEKYCMYLKREDLSKMANWLGIHVSAEATREEMFQQLYSSTGRDRIIAALVHEAEERIAERDALISNLGGGAQGFRDDIQKLRTFVETVKSA